MVIDQRFAPTYKNPRPKHRGFKRQHRAAMRLAAELMNREIVRRAKALEKHLEYEGRQQDAAMKGVRVD